MKNLGKIILFLFLLPHAAYAGVTASVDSKTVTLGDMVTLALNISGENVQKPNIYSLCGVDVVSSGSQTSIQIVNGDYQKSYILTYQFSPAKSCTIEPIEVSINGVKEKSSSIEIQVKPMDPSKDKNFVLTLQSDKKDVYVGEPFELTLLFKQKRGVDAIDSKFVPPELKGFWIKEESKPQSYNEGEYTITKLTYIMSAQRDGKLSVKPAQMKIASRSHSKDSWGAWVPQIKWRTYFSNELNINVKPVPNGTDLVGDLSISVVADKTQVNANEAVNITIEVKGAGNLEDIKSFKPYIDGVSIFDEKITVQNSKLTQKIAFVADGNFTIPSFSLHYFDLKTKMLKKIATKEIPINVLNAKAKEELTIKRQEETSMQVPAREESEKTGFAPLWLILAFLAGLACGIAIMLIKPWKMVSKEKSVSIKDPKILLLKLLPYKNDEAVQNIIEILEKNIYSKEKIEIDKKILKECLRKYGIA
ncbi:BatD family protein [bacterium]|nr:BatD family protein [bacterium]MBU1991228.1 BatD family protein [bacterium]